VPTYLSKGALYRSETLPTDGRLLIDLLVLEVFLDQVGVLLADLLLQLLDLSRHDL